MLLCKVFPQTPKLLIKGEETVERRLQQTNAHPHLRLLHATYLAAC